jgi:flagellar basal-body rod modification protein FlgD
MTTTGSIGPPIGNVGEKTGFSEGVGSSSGSTSKDDKDMFLKLLVAQMKYQDPSKPVDSSQFLAQTAQFTLVEKMDQLASAFASTQATSQLQSATAMLGNTVTYTKNDVDKTGVVTGVTISGGIPTLVVGPDAVALSDVKKVTKSSGSSST